jgi:hypothetical protein
MIRGMRASRMLLPVLATAALVGGATAATRPSLTVTPSQVHRGAHVTFSGSRWAHHVRVTLLLGKPNTGANKFATLTTNGSGRFRYVLPIKPTAPTGKYVILACRKNCATKVSRNMTILP